MKSETELQFYKAVALKDAGDPEGAIEALKEILQREPEDLATLISLGSFLKDLNRNEEAIGAFQKAVNLKPEAEMVSLGLFHSLWQAERHDDAFEEMRRFCSIKYSPEYALILEGYKPTEDEPD